MNNPQTIVSDQFRLTRSAAGWRLDEWSRGQYWRTVANRLPERQAAHLIKHFSDKAETSTQR